MGTCRLRLIALPLLLVALLAAPAATAGRDAGLAALQVALQSRGLYWGAIDGVKGPGTTAAIKRFQLRVGLTPDGVPGAKTRTALGRYGKHVLGSRPLTRGTRGWDVAALQFLLAWHGFPSATIDGGLGKHTEQALRHFQRWAGLEPDGVAGASTYAALRRAPASCPLSLAWPVTGPIGDPFGPRGNRFHAGIDIVAPGGTPVSAAVSGSVTWAARLAGGWGNLVVVAHAGGVRTMYAHLASIAVRVGQRVGAGDRLGTVGATGDATGPHLHFEVRLRGAAVDPRPALG
ncbi:MAG TPA: peptidoglycan DD-metalloendopeptidase family protein [Gaiellaceae bacterium]|nr:peptidoglycan DD-metalloendopeptidase family protein [Gaiellaceae bacterium]